MTPNEEMKGMSRRSFVWALGAVGATFGGWKWLSSQPLRGGALDPLRSGLEFNEGVWNTLYSTDRLCPTFPASMAVTVPRTNSSIGSRTDEDPDAFRFTVESNMKPQTYSLADLKALPKTEFTVEMKCVEGWSQIVTWAGVRLIDFLTANAVSFFTGANVKEIPKYVGFETPDEQYYVGLDVKSAVHPQTLLCYALNGLGLSTLHGGPVRLVCATKYGYKSMKRIGKMRLTNDRPRCYWAERGYDWYAGH